MPLFFLGHVTFLTIVNIECKNNETHCGFDFDRKPAHAFHSLESRKVSHPIRKVHQHRPTTDNNQQKSSRLYGRFFFLISHGLFFIMILCREQSAIRPVLVDVYSIISVNLFCFGSLVST